MRLAIARNYPLRVDSRAVGRNLRAIRKAAKESQETVAKRMGVVQVQISEWELGKYKSFDMETLFRLAKAYRTSIEALLVGVDIDYDKHRDLLRQRGDQPSALYKGESADVPASPAPSRLQQQHADLLAATENVAHQIIAMLAEQGVELSVGADDARARTRKSAARARPRKAG